MRPAATPVPLDLYLSLDAAPVFSLSSAAYFAEAVARAAEAGFTDVSTHWPRPAGLRRRGVRARGGRGGRAAPVAWPAGQRKAAGRLQLTS